MIMDVESLNEGSHFILTLATDTYYYVHAKKLLQILFVLLFILGVRQN